MRKLGLRSLYAISALAATTLAANAPAHAQVRHDADRGHSGQVYRSAGHQYCWYEHAWRGPGWYICGYQWRRDDGWGGYGGWHGWYPHRRHHHHHPHPQHPRPGPGRPPAGHHGPR